MIEKGYADENIFGLYSLPVRKSIGGLPTRANSANARSTRLLAYKGLARVYTKRTGNGFEAIQITSGAHQ